MNKLYCGIDIAKDTAVYCLLGPDGEPLERAVSFKNVSTGHKDALKWMRKLAKIHKPFELHVVMEATGVYYLSSAKFFYRQFVGWARPTLPQCILKTIINAAVPTCDTTIVVCAYRA